jgi:hypothetical protein
MSKRQGRKREKIRRHEPGDRPHRLGRQLAGGAGATVGATLLMGGVAQAAPMTFTVGSLADTTGATDCANATNTDCTLRQAIDDANNNSGADTIVFRSGLTGAITLTSGQLYITDPLTVQGPGANQVTVSGNHASRVFVISGTEHAPPEPSAISGLTVTAGDSGDFDGAAIYSVFAELTVSDSVVTDSDSGRGGGGIAAVLADSLTITSSAISGNDAAGEGGGVLAVYTPTTIRSSTISGNSAATGGGASNHGYGLTAVENSTIYGNSADNNGGGLYQRGGYDPDHTLIATASTITHNSAARGGGVACYGATYNGNAVAEPILRDAIVSQNNAASADQGNDLSCDFNNAPANAGTVEAAFSLLGSLDPGTTIDQTPPGSDILGQDPLLGPLASNGGPTQSVTPLCDSPAIDRGSAFGLTEDQRGPTRPVELADYPNSTAVGADGSDIGAVELQTSPGTGCTPAASTPPAREDPKCKKLRKKRKHQKRGLARAITEKKRSQIQANIKGTKKRLKKLGCS